MAKKGGPIQIVINDKETGASVKFEIEDETLKTVFYGKKIGDEIDGELIGFPGYRFQIRGGSDIAGFPHVKGLPGIALRKVLKSGPPGYRPRKYKIEKQGGGYKIINLKNVKRKKSLRGEELSEWTRQVNMVIIERHGKKPEELDDEAIQNDKLLVALAEKIGKLALRPGFKVIKVDAAGKKEPLEEYLIENYNAAEGLSKIYTKVGVYLIRLGDRKKEILRHTRYASKKHIDVLSSHIVKVVREYTDKVLGGELDINSEDVIENLTKDVISVFEKFLNNEIKERAKVKISDYKV